MSDEELRHHERAARAGDPAARAALERRRARAGQVPRWTAARRLPLPDPRDLAFGPDGSLFVAVFGDAQGALHVFDPSTWERVTRHDAPFVRRLAFDAAGRLLTGGGPEAREVDPPNSTFWSTTLWDEHASVTLGTLSTGWPGEAVTSLAAAPGGGVVCGPRVRLVDERGVPGALWPPLGYDPTTFVAASGAQVITVRERELVRWRLEPDGLRQASAGRRSGARTARAVALHGSRLAIALQARSGDEVRLADTAVEEAPRVLGEADVRGAALAFSPDGALLAVAGRRVDLLDVATGDLVARLPGRERARAVAVSPDGEHVAVGLRGGRVEVRRRSGAAVTTIDGLARLDGPVALAFSEDGALLRVVDRATVRTLRVDTGAPVSTFELPASAREAAFTLDGTVVAVLDDFRRPGRRLCARGADGREVAVHEEASDRLDLVACTAAGDLIGLDRGRALARRLPGGLVRRVYAHEVTAAALAPAGDLLFTAGAGGLRAWRVDDGAAVVGAPPGEGGDVVDLGVTSDGRLVGACADRRVRLWDATSLSLVGESDPGERAARRVVGRGDLVVSCEDDGLTVWRPA